jgi:hypothetical protein
MEKIINNLVSELGPKVSEEVSSKFDLSPHSAENVLPAIAPAVASSLQEKLTSGGENDFSSLMSGAADGSHGDSMLSNLFGSNLDSIVGNFAGQIGVDKTKANGILGSVVPMIMSFISDKTGGQVGNLAAMAASLGGLTDVSDSFEEITAKSGLKDKLAGFFGKRL